jgi:nicotinate-nucleotide pyrophosphorylase (carboxylating)
MPRATSWRYTWVAGMVSSNSMLDPVALRRYAELALAEDLASGDLTTDAVVNPSVQCKAIATAKSPTVVCGGSLFAACFTVLDPNVTVALMVPDGIRVEPGTDLWSVQGPAASILKSERSALNYTQRLCGISTLTRRFVDALPPGCQTRIADTRKTTPGLRQLERYAVRVGGGHNHRDNLGSAVLIKDNHIQAASGIANAVARARRTAPHTAKIEVEVEDLSMLDEGLAAGADILMLDNFAPDEIAEAVRRCKGKALVEVSGGVTLDRVHSLGELGVDVVSIGALTHSAAASDISLNITLLLSAS